MGGWGGGGVGFFAFVFFFIMEEPAMVPVGSCLVKLYSLSQS